MWLVSIRGLVCCVILVKLFIHKEFEMEKPRVITTPEGQTKFAPCKSALTEWVLWFSGEPLTASEILRRVMDEFKIVFPKCEVTRTTKLLWRQGKIQKLCTGLWKHQNSPFS